MHYFVVLFKKLKSFYTIKTNALPIELKSERANERNK